MWLKKGKKKSQNGSFTRVVGAIHETGKSRRGGVGKTKNRGTMRYCPEKATVEQKKGMDVGGRAKTINARKLVVK